MPQPDPAAENKPIKRFFYGLGILALFVSATALLVMGGLVLFAVMTNVEGKMLAAEHCVVNQGLLSYFKGAWVLTTGIALLLYTLDILRAQPLPRGLRIKVGAALFAAMTISTLGYYGGTVEQSAWRLNKQKICTTKPFVGCRLRF